MKVVVKKSVLDQVINQLVEERGYHSRRIDQIAGEGNPVLPDAQVATQLSQDTLDVEDPDFLPVNKRDLSLAASEIANKVSPGKIQKFYAGLKTLLKKTSSPDRQKGMSETDLMEALRPLVKEALLPAFLGQDSDEDDEDGGSVETGFRSGKTKDRPEGPKKYKTAKSVEDKKVAKILKRAAKAKAADAPIVSIGGKRLKSEEIDELEAMRQRWTMAPDLIAMRQIKDQIKLSLKDVVTGDASRLLDIFKKAELDLPETLAQAKIGLDIEESMVKLDGFDEMTPVRRIRFIDLAKPPREEIAKDLRMPIVHTGGPIEVTIENPDGTVEERVYFLVKNFPFNKQEYTEAFTEALSETRAALHDEAMSTLRRKAEKEQRKADAAATSAVDKKKRAATMQAELGSRFARAEAESMHIEDPAGFERQLKKLGIELSGFEGMSESEQNDVIERIAKNIERDRYQKVGLMARGRPAILDPDIEEIKISRGAIIPTTAAGSAPETLAETFFEKAFSPIAEFYFDQIAEISPDVEIEDIKQEIGGGEYSAFLSRVDKREWISLIARICQDLMRDKTTGEQIAERIDSVIDRVGEKDEKRNEDKLSVGKNVRKLFSLVEKPNLSAEDTRRLEKLGLDEISTVRYLFTKESDEQLRALVRIIELAVMYSVLAKSKAVSPEKEKEMIINYIDNNTTEIFNRHGEAIRSALELKKISLDDIRKMSTDQIYDIIGADILKTKAKKSSLDSQLVQGLIEDAIDAYLAEMDALFQDMKTSFDRTQSKKKKVKMEDGALKKSVISIIEFADSMIESA